MFDFGFTRFITNSWISFLWVLCVISFFIGSIGCVIGAFFNPPESLILLLAPIALALYLIVFRMMFEFTIVVFRIETHLRVIREHYEKM